MAVIGGFTLGCPWNTQNLGPGVPWRFGQVIAPPAPQCEQGYVSVQHVMDDPPTPMAPVHKHLHKVDKVAGHFGHIGQEAGPGLVFPINYEEL